MNTLLRQEADLAADIFAGTSDGIMVTDPQGRIVAVNPAFTAITGYTADDVLGKAPNILKSDRHDSAFYDALWHRLLHDGSWQGEIWNRRKTGEALLVRQRIDTIRDTDGRALKFVAIFSDMTELRCKDEVIRHQALHDALTGLPNGLLLRDRLNYEIEKAAQEKTQVAVFFLDVDRFKVVNDTLGHRSGDILLLNLTQRLKRCLQPRHSVARWSGDEFVVIMPEMHGTAQAATVAETLLSRIAEPLLLEGQEVHVTASVGVAMFPDNGTDVDVLMKNADAALYQAKAQGRNTFRFFDAGQNCRAVERLGIEARLRRAAANGDFELHYQPKLSLHNGHPCGSEALIRWRGNDGRLIPPAEFIPLAEETGLIAQIGDWVIEESCRQAGLWERCGMDYGTVAVNVSARQLRDLSLTKRIDAAMRRNGVSPGRMEVELTESTVMHDSDAAAGIFGLMREAGLGIAIDDFGTGYSSLAYLKRLPLTGLKIDRSFVAEADTDADDAAIVATIIKLAAIFKLTVVAEGVESKSQLNYLTRQGCDLAQGYLFSKPLAAGEYAEWLRNWHNGGHDLMFPTQHRLAMA